MGDNVDDRRSGWGPLALVALVLGLLFGTGGTGNRGGDGGKAGSSKGSTAGAASSASDVTPSDFRRPYEEFRRSPDVPIPARTTAVNSSPPPTEKSPPTPPIDPAGAASELGTLMADDALAGRVVPEFIIATVPDPLDTRFAYRFDAVVDTLRMAAVARGWMFDRFWLPWWPSGRQFADRSELKIPADERAGAPHVRQPGVLLFRKAPAAPGMPARVLIVWLVGETPTSGVAKEAMATSLRVIESYWERVAPSSLLWPVPAALTALPGSRPTAAWLAGLEASRAYSHNWEAIARDSAGPFVATLGGVLTAEAVPWSVAAGVAWLLEQIAPERVVRLVAPMFSGSQTSIEQVVGGWAARMRATDLSPFARRWCIRLRSGSANALDRNAFKSSIEAKARGTVVVQADTTMIPYEAVYHGLLDTLHRLNNGHDLGKVALLTESDTGFGQNVANLKDGRSAHDVRAASLEDDRPHFGATVTTMPFPYQIAQVAVAYAQGDGDGKDARPIVRSSSRLSLPPGEQSQPRDKVPLLSPSTTTPIGEFSMTKLLETISGESYRYVGIVATDVRDTIFLSRLIRQYSPDVQIFVPGGDLLLGHPEFASEMRGTIVASTYPLFSRSQRWTPPFLGDTRRHVFDEESDQGIYNATVSLLTGRGDVVSALDLFDYGPPYDAMADLPRLWNWGEKSSARGRAVPNLWISVVGQRGLWPLRYVPVPNPTDGAGLPLFAALPPAARDREEAVARTAMLLPRFTWQWTILALLYTLLAWVLFVQQSRLISPAAVSGTCAAPYHLFATWLPEASKGRASAGEALHREVLVGVALLVYLIAYWLVVLDPLWTAFRLSPWPQFLPPEMLWKAPTGAVGPVVWALLMSALSASTGLMLVHALIGRAESWGRWGKPSVFALLILTLFGVGPVRVMILFAVLACLSASVAWGIVVVLRRLGRVCEKSDPFDWKASILELVKVVVFAVIAAILASIVLPILHCLVWPGRPDDYSDLLRLERALDFSSGVSPAIPITGLTLLTLAWVGCQLRRYDKADRAWGKPQATRPRGDAEPEVPAVATADGKFGLYQPARPHARDLVETLHDAYLCCCDLTRRLIPRVWAERWPALAAGAVGGVLAARLWQQAVPAVDFPGWATYLMLFWIWFLALSVMLALCRFISLWLGLLAVLRKAARLPMARAFDRLPPAFTRVFGRYLDHDAPPEESLVVPVQQWAWVVTLYERDGVWDRLRDAFITIPNDPDVSGADRKRGVLETRYHEAVAALLGEAVARPPEGRVKTAARIQQQFLRDTRDDARADVAMACMPTWLGLRNASRACFDLLDPYWQAKPATFGFADRSDKPGQDDPGEFPGVGAAETDLRAWLRAAEELVALELITLVSQIGVQLKNLATYLSIAPIILLLAVATYPIQPARLLQLTLWGLLLVVVATVVSVYVAMERDVLLSRVAKTVPNSIAFDRQFLGSVLKFLVPLLTIALAQFPFFSDTLNQWLEPLGRILK